MKLLLGCVSALIASTAFAVSIMLRPYAPSPFATAPFSLPSLCHVNYHTFESTGTLSGVCRYYGYNNINVYAIVQWSFPDGQPTSATPCVLYAFQNPNEPVCPALIYGPFTHLDDLPVFQQSSDKTVSGQTASTYTAVIVDVTPRYSALITP